MSCFLKTGLAGLLIIFLCSCAGGSYWVWEHPDGLDQQRFLKDQEECRKLAQTEADRIRYRYYFYDFPYYIPHHYRDRNYFPYDPWSWNSHYRFIRYQEDLEMFYRICLQSKGWVWLRKTAEPPESQPHLPTKNLNE